jgi:opacity protein-like surface antigen
MMGIASVASAEGYFGIGGMGVFLEDSDLSGLNDLDLINESVEISYDTGWGAMILAGIEGDLFRLEGEVAYRDNDIDEVEISGFTGEVDDGDIQAVSGMINPYLQVDLGGFRPFVGAGAGAANIEVDINGNENDDDVFAYQGIVGIAIPAGATTIDIGYRYFATDDPEFEIDDSNRGVEGEYKSHNVYVAFRF